MGRCHDSEIPTEDNFFKCKEKIQAVIFFIIMSCLNKANQISLNLRGVSKGYIALGVYISFKNV